MTERKPRKTKSGGKISFADNKLVVSGANDLEFEDLTPLFAERLLLTTPADDVFIGEVALSMTNTAKIQLRNLCKIHGGALWEIWKDSARRWAGLINTDNEWQLAKFEIVFRAEVNIAWIDAILLTSTDVRFVLTPSSTRVMTFDEFEWRYGATVVDYMKKYLNDTHNRITRALEACASDLVTKRLTVMDTESFSVTEDEFCGPQFVHPSEWLLPTGYSYIAEA